jgi:hypothetical protein
LGTGFLVRYRLVSAVKRVEFVSDRMSYIVLGGRLYNIIVLSVHAPRRKDNSEDSSYEELEQDFYHFPKYQANILVRDVMQNWGQGIYSNPQLGMAVYFMLVMIMVLE